jgi:hypothetical protein
MLVHNCSDCCCAAWENNLRAVTGMLLMEEIIHAGLAYQVSEGSDQVIIKGSKYYI